MYGLWDLKMSVENRESGPALRFEFGEMDKAYQFKNEHARQLRKLPSYAGVPAIIGLFL